MNLGKAGLAIIQHWEQGPDGGPALKAYQCDAGVWTIGFGHTKGVRPGDKCTIDEVERWLYADTAWASAVVNGAMEDHGISLTQNQFDALVCLVFNVGATAFQGSTLLKKFAAGDFKGVAEEFPKWVKGRINGQLTTLKGLVSRRAQERQLFETPNDRTQIH